MVALTEAIAASGDDGDVVDTTFNSSKVNLEVGNSMAGQPSRFFCRFTTVTIPAGATIDDAKLQFICDVTTSDSFAITIRGDDSDNPSAYTNTSAITSATLTTASVAWTPGAKSADATVDSPEIKTVIQEIVDRSGWGSGNAMIIHVIYNGESVSAEAIKFSSQDHGSDTEPQLILNYTPPASAVGGTTQKTLVLGMFG